MSTEQSGAGTIQVRCPHCGAEFQASVALIGRTGPCGVCRTPFAIVAPTAAAAVPAAASPWPAAEEASAPPAAAGSIAAPSSAGFEGVETEWIALEEEEGLGEAASGPIPTTADFPVVEMNVKAGLAMWAMAVLLMMSFAYMRSAAGLGGGLFLLALIFAGYAIAVAVTLHGTHAWIASGAKNPVEQRLLRVLRSAAEKAGLPVPRIALGLREPEINVWTYGLSKKNAYIVVTGSFLDHVQPTDQELEAVLAHELSHIHYGDFIISTLMRFPVWLMDKVRWLMAVARTVATGVLHFTAEMAGGCGWIGLVMILGLVGFILYMSLAMAIVGGLVFVGMLFLNAFEREREYLADMYSAQLLGSTRPIQSSLAKLQQAADRVIKELEHRVENTPEGGQVDLQVAAPAMAFDGEQFIAESLDGRPSFMSFLQSGEWLAGHPVTKHRVYFLQHPRERRQFWSRIFEWLEHLCGRFITYRPREETLGLRAAWWTGAAAGAPLAVLPVLSNHWIVDVLMLVSLVTAGIVLGRQGRANLWSPSAFAGGTVLAAFSTATVLLVLGAMLLNPLAVAFLFVFLVALAIYGVCGVVAISR